MRAHIACILSFMFALASTALAQRSTPVQLVHPSGAAGDQFGRSVAIDGDTMIVGAPTDDVGANVDQGSAHVYRWTGSGWTFEATLTATGGAAGDLFGTSVAISGDTVIVGAYLDDVGAIANQGSAYVFTRAGTTWTQEAQLNVSGAANDWFGYSVAITGNTAVVGAPNRDFGPITDQGAAFVFTRSGTTWTLQSQLSATGGAASDLFGWSVGISGDSVIASAPQRAFGANANQGAAYIFTRSGATWSQQAQLSATGGAANDDFGFSVAIDGNTAVVGAYLDDVGANVDQGSAFVFVRSGTTWTQQAQLNAAGGAASDDFGCSVAISGDTVIVGAFADDLGVNVNQGSACVFNRSGTTWTQQSQFTASDGTSNDVFGWSVAISGDTAIVGAYADDVGANADQGSAWVFSRLGSKWIGPDLTLVAADGAAADYFGSPAAISGDTAIVGADFDDIGLNTDQGSAYIFVRSGTTWTQQAKLTAADGATNDYFGTSVAISGDTAIVGAPGDDILTRIDQGSAYVFTRSGTTWTQQAKLTAADGAATDFFGSSVALSGDTAVVGAYGDDFGTSADQGSAYIFVRSGTAWTQQAKLAASDGAAGDNFGTSVTISSDTVIVGALLDTVGANTNQGSAYVFVRSGTAWSLQAKLTAADGAAFDVFGISVSLSGNTAIVGATAHDIGANPDQGAAYVFVRSGTTWTQQARLAAADGAASEYFGSAVALSGNTAIVGASRQNIGANIDQGAAYVFVASGNTWIQQAKLTAADGAAFDYFGSSVAISGDTFLVGGYADDVGANTDQGSVRVFDVPANDFPLVHNDVTDTFFPTLASALLPATSGQQITATESAWRSISSINTLGRSLALLSSGNLRTPSSSTLELGGSSALAVPPGNVAEFDGQIRVSSGASADLTADAFRLGSRGILTARTNSSLTINSPTASLDGQTRLEQGASLTFAGSATAIGATTVALNSNFTLGGTFTNIDTFTITSGTISAPLLWNRAQANIFGSSAVFGSYTNEAGATTTIRSGSFFIFGSLTNNGTIVGTICSNCLGSPPNLDINGDLNIGTDANLNMPFDGSLVRVGGSFDCAINSNTRFDLSLATLQMEGSGSIQTLEAMSTDIGPDASGLDRTLAGHYPIHTLIIGGSSPSTVQLVDLHDNDTLGQSSCEAIYVDTLRIEAGARLMNSGCSKIYYNTLVNNGTVDTLSNLIHIAPPCAADFNHDNTVDFFDYLDFVAAFAATDSTADFNHDSVIDFFDYLDFVAAFATGC